MHIYPIYLLNFAPLRNLPLSPTSLLFLNTEESIRRPVLALILASASQMVLPRAEERKIP